MIVVKVIDIEDALQLEDVVFIDVRSPGEYQTGSFLGAINIPILDDSERAIVGTIYRQDSKEDATQKGLDLVSQKLPELYKKMNEYSLKYKHVVVFCWRGGMRSKSVCTLLNMLNLDNIYQLKGGYKSYRKYVMEFLEKKVDTYEFIMLHGLTGVGKTHILNELEKKGCTVLDLESFAKNKGSVFGGVGFYEYPSQKTFESCIFHKLYKSTSKYVWVESESKRIGSVQVPEPFYSYMIKGNHILVQTSINNRIKIILKDYIEYFQKDQDKIIKGMQHLRKRLGNELIDDLLEKLEKKQYEYVIEYLMKYYYDPMYQYSIDKYAPFDLEVDYDQIDAIIPTLVKFVKDIEDGR